MPKYTHIPEASGVFAGMTYEERQEFLEKMSEEAAVKEKNDTKSEQALEKKGMVESKLKLHVRFRLLIST